MRDEPAGTARIADQLLHWYDRNARVMPWRVSPADRAAGQRSDPYAVWLSEVMLQQTTVATVRDYFRKFIARWPTVQDLAAAQDADVMAAWAGLGYYARARNLLKCARAVSALGGFPDTHAGLIALPGIGPYTASAVAAIAFDRAEVVVDGNVERVMARLHNDPTPLPAAKPRLTAYAAALTPQTRPGDYAQAVMDLGATICTPRNPACGICPLRTPCAARAEGTAVSLPRKTPKAAKPVRAGHIYLARSPQGAWLLERRPDRGLLGGMLGWPGSEWVASGEGKAAQDKALVPPMAERTASEADTPAPVTSAEVTSAQDTSDRAKSEWAESDQAESERATPQGGGRNKPKATPDATPPLPADWQRVGEVRHTFTHFHLILTVHRATIPDTTPGLTPAADFRPGDLPTVMRKAYDLVAAADAPLASARLPPGTVARRLRRPLPLTYC
ncbi:A/G-specific adenine glycosylase [Roseicitreum antarcticum]|uniref:Adenine DNA glycosylase n=1 Tax=Roseicitreum antarcticum TaxID=564137 RepID=A0A1H2X9B1_9RHOB|nr:A/G-specific adenine glycosylase [Roseicitreum antarcticum]SDW89054.1 A/G-specific DNA-adenine glycosylase [Roseicitreum antarcticum]